ncbi:unnamed protein product [Parnassius apollo]|uniref:(apollo) hypothetical protein n=1 Tax=Parnassius apollo TaxID=110799 RepID=A0A8S3X2T0_PARAO|nr:unnamed protein product [Parnassius apollo]
MLCYFSLTWESEMLSARYVYRSPASVESASEKLLTAPASVESVSEKLQTTPAQAPERVNETKIDHEMVRAGSEEEQQGRVAMTRSPEHQCSPVYCDSNIMNQGETDIKNGKIASFSDVVR